MEHLPRLKDLGVDILYFMPLQPIGIEARKGTLGSPYAIRDYRGINPEYGTAGELRALIDAAHGMGFRVIMDWVGNHTSPDSVLWNEHPEWFKRDENGKPLSTPWWDWDDIIELDYRQRNLRDYMIDTMVYWVREFDLDGFRCDVAGTMPTEMWVEARRAMEAVKPVLMLAEWESRDLHVDAFDLSYGWVWYNSMKMICAGMAEPGSLAEHYGQMEKSYPGGAWKALFLSNHDKNAWEGTEYEVFGEAVPAVLALSMVSEGVPFLFNGIEAGFDRRLPFFEKDHIEWQDDEIGNLIRKLTALRKSHPAMKNRPAGSGFFQIKTDNAGQIFAGKREADTVLGSGNSAGIDGAVMIFCNLSDQEADFEILSELCCDVWKDWLRGESEIELKKGELLKLGPWDFRIFVV